MSLDQPSSPYHSLFLNPNQHARCVVTTAQTHCLFQRTQELVRFTLIRLFFLTEAASGSNPLDTLSEEHRELIEKLVVYQDKYELPSQDDIDRLAVST